MDCAPDVACSVDKLGLVVDHEVKGAERVEEIELRTCYTRTDLRVSKIGPLTSLDALHLHEYFDDHVDNLRSLLYYPCIGCIDEASCVKRGITSTLL